MNTKHEDKIYMEDLVVLEHEIIPKECYYNCFKVACINMKISYKYRVCIGYTYYKKMNIYIRHSYFRNIETGGIVDPASLYVDTSDDEYFDSTLFTFDEYVSLIRKAMGKDSSNYFDVSYIKDITRENDMALIRKLNIDERFCGQDIMLSYKIK